MLAKKTFKGLVSREARHPKAVLFFIMPIKCPIKRKEYNRKNKEKVAASHKKYRENNKEKIKKYQEQYRRDKKEDRKAYRAANKESILERQRKYVKDRRKNDPLFKMCGNVRSRIHIAFKKGGFKKNGQTQDLLGTDWETVFNHIEKLFTEGMSWDNYGEWHIDHKIPLASAKTEEEIIKLCHYENLQPLWALENIIKSDKI